jgi:hypothetical protein
MAKKSEKQNGVVQNDIKREETTAADFVSLYSNDTQVQLSPWDVRVIFGVIDQPPTRDRPTNIVKQVGEVRMSLHHAKKLAQILTAQVELFERISGAPLSVPEK